MILISPSMLSADSVKLGEELRAIESAGADCVHWDIMDGSFVDAITFGAHIIADNRKISSLPFDVHLMIENPDKHLKMFAEAGADSIIVHAEATKHLHKTLSNIKKLGKLAGVALNPATSIDCLTYCMDIIDIVLIMSVNPGKANQSFIISQLDKIENLKKKIDSTKFLNVNKIKICVDGGINAETAKECVKRGADSLVAGSFIFKNKNNLNYKEAIEALR